MVVVCRSLPAHGLRGLGSLWRDKEYIVVDQTTFTEPCQYPTGIHWVLVNGEVVIEEGTHTGVRTGFVLRRGPSGV